MCLLRELVYHSEFAVTQYPRLTGLTAIEFPVQNYHHNHHNFTLHYLGNPTHCSRQIARRCYTTRRCFSAVAQFRGQSMVKSSFGSLVIVDESTFVSLHRILSTHSVGYSSTHRDFHTIVKKKKT